MRISNYNSTESSDDALILFEKKIGIKYFLSSVDLVNTEKDLKDSILKP